MQQPLPASQVYFPALTGLRAVAAFMVFFFHFNPFHQLYRAGAPNSFSTQLLGAFVGQWHTGVTIFFVLSGFLITIRYANRLEPSWAWLKTYALNRFARIYPLYFLLTALSFVAMAGHLWTWYTWNPTSPLLDKAFAIVANLTLTRAWFRDFYLLGLPTAWSLTVEECFYAAAPALLLVARKQPGVLPLFVLVCWGAGALLTAVATYLHAYGGFMQPLSFTLHYTFFGRCSEFLVGMRLALWLKARPARPKVRGTTWLGASCIGGCLVGMGAISWQYSPSPEWPEPLSALLINFLLLPFGIALLLYGLLYERTWLQRLLQSQIFGLLGRSSYAFYLLHVGVFNDLLERAVGHRIAVAFITFNLAAVLLYTLIERPARQAIQRRFRPAVQIA